MHLGVSHVRPNAVTDRGKVTKSDALAAMAAAAKRHAERYLASVIDIGKEEARLTDLLMAGGDFRAIRVRLEALGQEAWPRALIYCYRVASRAERRERLVKSAIFEARDSLVARELGVLALKDRSYLVRERAAAVLAYSLDRSVLPVIEEALKSEQREEIRSSLRAAINAINKQNHNLYIDREERGGVAWGVNPWDSGDPPVQRAAMYFEIENVELGWATEV
jgi:hypothetical protein